MNALYSDSGMSDEEHRSGSPNASLASSDIRVQIAVTKFQEY